MPKIDRCRNVPPVPDPDHIPSRIIAAALIMRLILVPIIAGYVLIVVVFGEILIPLLEDEGNAASWRVFQFVMILEASVPTAQICVFMTQALGGDGTK